MPNNTKKEECCKKCLKCPDYDNHNYCHAKDCECHASPQSPLSKEKKIHVHYFPEGEVGCACGKSREEVSFSSNEDWEIEFNEKFPTEVRLMPETTKSLKDFIRTTRLEAQRSLAEDMEKYMSLFSDGTHSNVVRFLVSRGLLPKITE